MTAITTRAGKGTPLTNAEVDANFTGLNTDKEDKANKGVANGYAGLDAAGKVPANQLPSYVDDVLEFANLVAFPATGEAGKIYVALDTNKTYRWSGSAYVEISALSGTPTAPTAANGTNNTQIATTAFVLATRLDQLAAPTADVSMNSRKITGLAEPVGAQDAATKNYVDMAVQGLTPKQSVKAATTANIASLSGTMTIDGIALVAGDRTLVKDQTTASQNGIYVVQSGAWTRADDASTWAELVSAYVFVEQGTTNADNGYLCTVDAGGTLGTTAVTWVQFSGAGQIIAGAGLTKTGNQIDVVAGTGITVASDNVALTGQALALHNLATNGIFVRTGAGTVTARSVATSGNGISVSNGDGVSGNPTLSLSTALSTVGGLTPAADQLAYYTGASAATLTSLTSFGRSLIDDADAATARTTLGLGTMATQNANSVAITGALGYTPVNKAGDTITGTINNIHSSGSKLFKTANNLYETVNFGPRPANDGICSVTFEYDTAGNWWKFDANGSQFNIIGVDYSEFRIRRSDGFVAIGKSLEPTQKLDVDGNVYARGAFLGQGSFVCSFTVDINANTNRAPGVYGSYASSATNTPTNSGILWNGMSGINGGGQYDGGQFWQDYYSGAFYHRRRWGGGWSAWYYVGG